MPEPLRLIYFDPESTGYHSGHVRLMAEQCASDPRVGALILAVGPDFEAHSAMGFAELRALSAKIGIEVLAPDVAAHARAPHSPWIRGRARAAASRALLAAHPGHVIFHSLFDQALIGLLARPGAGLRRTGGILHAPPNDPGRAPSRRDRAMMAAYRLAGWLGGPHLMSFDDVFIERHRNGLSRGWTFTPDPLPLTPAQAARLASAAPPLPAGARVRFLLFGSLGERKGLSRLMDALDLLPAATRQRIDLRLIGLLSEYPSAEAADAVRARLRQMEQAPGLMVRFEERFASEDDLVEALIASDAVLTVYDHHKGVSNALYWAAAAGRPVISQDTGYLGAAVLRHGLGMTCDAGDPTAIAAALARACEPGWATGFDGAALRAWAGDRSARAFCDAILTGMCKANVRR